MDKNIILFRADGHQDMGLGHLYRSAALALMLHVKFEVVLAYGAAPEKLIAGFSEIFDRLVALNPGEDDPGGIKALLELAAKNTRAGQSPIIVLDGYHFNAITQQKIKEEGYQLVCIDDIHSHHFISDLVINHAPVRGLAEYYDYGPDTSLAFGLGFALLRPLYLAAAQNKQRVFPSERRYFICFGGSDFNNISGQLIKALTEMGYDCPLDVVLGAANQHGGAVEAVAREYKGHVSLYSSLNDEQMIGLYGKATVAFLPASTVLVEAMAAGIPIITGYYVDNQINIYHGFQNLGLMEGVGDWNKPIDLTGAIERVEQEGHERSVRRYRQYIDGYSKLNHLQIFEQLELGEVPLVVRPAQPEDAKIYFRWANEPAVRANAIQREVIIWEDHLNWFSRKLLDDDTLLLYYNYLGADCGQVRFDVTREEAIISVSLAATMRGLGLAKRVLRLAEEQLVVRYPGVKVIVALIRSGNLPSQKSFAGFGYRFSYRVSIGGAELLKYTKECGE